MFLFTFSSLLLSIAAVPLLIFSNDSVDGANSISERSIRHPSSQEIVVHDLSEVERVVLEPPTCVGIPNNLSLCSNIGYGKMRLPNLLGHDSIDEVQQQATSWLPLININCDPDAQLFLCSLFAPVCLDHPIYPCRSLCEKVRSGCGTTMATYGFPWPPMLDCHRFPLDNDMCITSQILLQNNDEAISHKVNSQLHRRRNKNSDKRNEISDSVDNTSMMTHPTCPSKTCNQLSSYENILDNYCQSDFVVKMRFRRSSNSHAHLPPSSTSSLVPRRVNSVFKTWNGTRSELRKLRKPNLVWSEQDECCAQWIERIEIGDSTSENEMSEPDVRRHGGGGSDKNHHFLVMGDKREDGRLQVKFIVPWSKSKEMRRARKMFKQIDCSNLAETTRQMAHEAFIHSYRRSRRHHFFSKGGDSKQHRYRRAGRHMLKSSTSPTLMLKSSMRRLHQQHRSNSLFPKLKSTNIWHNT